MKAFIIMYNRLTWARSMAAYLVLTGCEPIFIDNASTYPPLLKYYEECPFKVERMDKNYGHLVFWKSGLFEKYTDRYYIVTDHDLDLSNIPHDYTNVLFKGLETNPSVIKSGFSLEINNLPVNNFTKKVVEWETKFWQTQKIEGYYRSDVDTTFALYDRERDFGELPNNRFFSATRSERPYTAIHLPWYLTKESIEESEEEQFYQKTTCTYWSQIFKETWNL